MEEDSNSTSVPDFFNSTTWPGSDQGDVRMGPEKVATLAMQFGITASNLLLNTLALAVLLYGKAYHQTKGIFIINLTLADLLMGVGLTLTVTSVIEERWALGAAMCQVTSFVTLCAAQLSMVGQTVLCLDRYLAIQKPYLYLQHSTTRKALIACLLVWSVLLCMDMAIVITHDAAYVSDYQVCSVQDSIGLRTTVAVLFTTCYTTIAYTSIVISQTVSRHRRAIAAQDFISSGGKKASLPVDDSIMESFQSVALMGAAMLVSAIPFLIMVLTPAGVLPRYVFIACSWFVSVDTVLNVLIYGYKTDSFRRDLRRMCGEGWQRARLLLGECHGVTCHKGANQSNPSLPTVA